MGTKEFKIIFFADDAVLSKDEDNLQRLLYRFETVTKELFMENSVQKTKSLTISREPRSCKLAIYNKSVEHTFSFKYFQYLSLWFLEARSEFTRHVYDP